mgnify:CR=1 FL=1
MYALLITAALGAMVLAHRERLTPRESQADRARSRVRAYGAEGAHLGPEPAPGVYARHNAVDVPARLPDGSPSDLSVNAILAARTLRLKNSEGQKGSGDATPGGPA